MKRQIEVFGAGCPLCEDVIGTVNDLACDDCEVTVHNLSELRNDTATMEKVRQYGIRTVPAVVVDGKLADCCHSSGIDLNTLREAGVGQPR